MIWDVTPVVSKNKYLGLESRPYMISNLLLVEVIYNLQFENEEGFKKQ